MRDEHGTQVKALMEEQRRQQHELLQVRNSTQHVILDNSFCSALPQNSMHSSKLEERMVKQPVHV